LGKKQEKGEGIYFVSHPVGVSGLPKCGEQELKGNVSFAVSNEEKKQVFFCRNIT
jgi:hypothetical protein